MKRILFCLILLATPALPQASGPLMTKEEILGFLKARIGSDPWRHPNKPQTIAELAGIIGARGVNFRLSSMDAYMTDLINAGANESTIKFYIDANYGPPAQYAYYFSTWEMFVTGAPTYKVVGNRAYRVNETGGLSGTLRIDPNGTYQWKPGPKDSETSGRWRQATVQELKIGYQGGAGIVLPNSYTGQDWIVTKRDLVGQHEEMITVAVVNSRGQRHLGTRKK
ncbi:MAG: hypothetical protein HYZ37_13865 [Candidatus Solibacter usitatus]|nr:hypothetical protein [Candidatus Solibacter usitatus]